MAQEGFKRKFTAILALKSNQTTSPSGGNFNALKYY